MYEDFLPERLARLRTQKGVSARDMSLSLGQANNYINNIENKKSLPWEELRKEVPPKTFVKPAGCD